MSFELSGYKRRRISSSSDPGYGAPNQTHVAGLPPRVTLGTSTSNRRENSTSGIFNNASGFVLYQPKITQNFVNDMSFGKAELFPYICPEAAVDSSARHPPPTCYQGTREQIRTKLTIWLDSPERQSKVIWLTGPAGTGKSAVSQTFAELCLKRGRLGAAFFFSRKGRRNQASSVIPTLAYQLAVHFPDYEPLLGDQIAHDPTIVSKAPRAQFERLIIEPFSVLWAQEHRVTQEPLLILLDGLDACREMVIQCEFAEMIDEVAQRQDLPLLWLICSRPEPNFGHVLLRPGCGIDYDKEAFSIDTKARDDVNRYLRSSFEELRAKFWDVTSPSWPSDIQFFEVLRIASGLFVLASTIIDYIGNPVYANPTSRLTALLEFTALEDTQVTSAENPLRALDILYSDILTEVPDDILPTTRRILGHILVLRFLICDRDIFSAQALCNFMNIDQVTFYRALRRLHSVVQIPSLEDASSADLQFHHASFPDYLLNSTRSGKFAIEWGEAVTDMAKSCLFWYKIDLNSFHMVNNYTFDTDHDHEILPHLTWVSPDDRQAISRQVARFSEYNCWTFYDKYTNLNATHLLPQLDEFDFRYIRMGPNVTELLSFTDWLWEQGLLNTASRFGSLNELELRLLESIKGLTTRLEPTQAVDFPLLPKMHNKQRQGTPSQIAHFFVGKNEQACLFWFSYSRYEPEEQYTLGRSWFLGWQDPALKGYNPSLQYVVTTASWDNILSPPKLLHQIITL